MPSAFMQDETGAAWKPFSKGSRGAVGPTVAASPASPLPAGLLRSPQKPPLPSAGPCPRGGAPLTVLKGPGSIAEPLPALPEAFLTSAATNPSAPWWPTLCGSLDGAQTSATTLPCQPRECKLGGEDGGEPARMVFGSPRGDARDRSTSLLARRSSRGGPDQPSGDSHTPDPGRASQ
jgi:hypothetical protein